MRVSAFLVVGALASQASASNWVFASSSSQSDIKLYVDADSLSQTGGMLQAWIKVQAGPAAKLNYAESKELWKIDCPSRNKFLASWIEYDRAGKVTRSKTEIETPYDYEPVAPDTMGDEVLSKVCGK